MEAITEVNISSGGRTDDRGARQQGKRRLKAVAFLPKIIYWSWIVLGVCSLFQALYFENEFNLEAIGCILFAWGLTTKFLMQKSILVNYPLSSFIILGFVATQFYFPLIFTTLEFKPVVFNLLLPQEVFFHSTASLLVLMFSHVVYRISVKRFQNRPHSLLEKGGFFIPPSAFHLWIMGFIGMAAAFYIFFISAAGKEITGNPADKIIQGFIPFGYAPFFIPFARLYGGRFEATKNFYVLLGFFTLLLFIVSMGRNSRSVFIMGFASVGFSYGLGLLLGAFKTPKVSMKVLVFGFLGLWAITGPFSDLGTAMVLVRDKRNDISKAELISLTLEAYKDKSAIKQRRLDDKLQESAWDERYLDNVFTARFSNIKFNDACLKLASEIGENNPQMFEFSVDYVWGILPSPILNIVNPGINKENLFTMSFGDYLYYVSGRGAAKDIFGGYRTGHFAGTGMAAFGLWYLMILGVLMLPVFFLFDKLVMIKRFSGPFPRIGIRFSMCGLLSATSIFMFMLAESVSTIATFIIRGWIQMAVLYFIIFHAVDFILSVFKKQRSREQRSGTHYRANKVSIKSF